MGGLGAVPLSWWISVGANLVFAQICCSAVSIGITLDPGEHKVRPYVREE